MKARVRSLPCSDWLAGGAQHMSIFSYSHSIGRCCILFSHYMRASKSVECISVSELSRCIFSIWKHTKKSHPVSCTPTAEPAQSVPHSLRKRKVQEFCTGIKGFRLQPKATSVWLSQAVLVVKNTMVVKHWCTAGHC